MKTQKIKKFYEARFQRELEDIQKDVNLVVESIDLLEQLESKSIGEFELKINEKSGFVNALMSATAYGKDSEYKRLLAIEKQLNGRLSADDLTSLKQLKNSFKDAVKEKHTEYYSDEDVKAKKVLDKVLELYNALSHNQRKNIGYSRTGELMYSPFSTLI